LGFDKVIMQAGGIGYGKLESIKKTPQTGDKIVILGGENYRIGMGGAAVSSADTGALLWYRVKRNPTFESRNAKELPMPFVDW
jgi:phosphoribosylformylglycinamidine (FGAM) synthase-like enzyme